MKAREIHAQVGHLREAGKFDESISLAEDAKKAYIDEGDMVGLADLYGDISLSYRHKNDFDKAEEAAQEAVRIAKENNLKGDLARPLFNLAKVQESKGDTQRAIETYKESIRIFKEENPSLHNRSGVLADMNIHLATCKKDLKGTMKAITDLENSDEKEVSKYNYDVWLSGAHMRIAEMLKYDNPQKAKEHLNMAKEIIDSNPDLVIRKDQWNELAKSI